MPDFTETAEFNRVRVKAETAAALLCVVDHAEVWIPKSQIDDESEVYQAEDFGTLIISEWIARQKGLL